MSAVTADLVRRIDDERRDLKKNVSELAVRATAAVDWREHVRRHPALMVAAALGSGVALAQLGGRRRYRTAPLSSEQAVAADRQDRSGPGDGPLGSIVGALAATATSALVAMLADAVPGFIEEHRKRDARPLPSMPAGVVRRP